MPGGAASPTGLRGLGPVAPSSSDGSDPCPSRAGVTVVDSSPVVGWLPTRPSFTANRSAKSQPMSTSTVQSAGSPPKFRIRRSSRMPWPTYRSRKTMRVESARPVVGRQRDTNVAENGSSVTAARGSVAAPLIRISNLERNAGVPHEQPVGRPG